jgi:hypothetical protein
MLLWGEHVPLKENQVFKEEEAGTGGTVKTISETLSWSKTER